MQQHVQSFIIYANKVSDKVIEKMLLMMRSTKILQVNTFPPTLIPSATVYIAGGGFGAA